MHERLTARLPPGPSVPRRDVLTGKALRVAVTDPRGERLPIARIADPGDQFGRGLLLIRTYAGRWAVEKLTVGKTVWAELDIPGSLDAQRAEPSSKVSRGDLAARRREMRMAAEWQNAAAEAREATGFTGNVIQHTVDGIGAALRLDHRADFYTELGDLAGSGGFEAFLNHWWAQALADTAPDEDVREQAIDFADVAVSLFARAVGGPNSTQAEMDAIVTGAEAC